MIELEEVYDIWKTPFFKTNLGIALIILFFVFFLLLFYLIYRYFKRRSLQDPKRLNSELKKLQNKLPEGKEEINKLYLQVSNILKKYILYSFDIDQGMTDKEIIKYMKKYHANLVDKFQLSRIFNKAQHVKFSLKRDTISDIYNDIHLAISFIEKERFFR